MAPSTDHRSLQIATRRWLFHRASGSGIQWAPELAVGEKYIADCVAFFWLQHRFMEQYKVQFDKLHSDLMFVFEVKVSRADFLATFRDKNSNRYNPVAHFHILVTPKNLIKHDEIPENWGLLEKCGAGLSLKKIPTFFETQRQQIHSVGYAMLWKREPLWAERCDCMDLPRADRDRLRSGELIIADEIF